MTKTTSQTRAICKILALIPAFTAAVLVFSAKTTAQDNIIPFPTVALMDNFHSPFFDRRWLTKVPTAKIWKQFQDTTLYTVFLDDKPVDNAYLKTISRWKIAFYWSNMPNKQKDGKIYLYLFTKEGYESLKKQSSQPITVENLVKYSPHIGFKSDFHKSTKNGKPFYTIGEMAGDVAEK